MKPHHQRKTRIDLGVVAVTLRNEGPKIGLKQAFVLYLYYIANYNTVGSLGLIKGATMDAGTKEICVFLM